jgi:hypothetical protein
LLIGEKITWPAGPKSLRDSGDSELRADPCGVLEHGSLRSR